jgi:hypothetical protein
MLLKLFIALFRLHVLRTYQTMCSVKEDRGSFNEILSNPNIVNRRMRRSLFINSKKLERDWFVLHFIYHLAMLRKAQLTVVIPADIRSWYIYNTAYVLLLEHLAA